MQEKDKKAALSVRKHSALVFFGFTVVMLILISITLRGIGSLGSVTAHMSQVVEVNHAKIALMTTMREMIRERMLQVYVITSLDDPFQIEEEWEKYSAHASEFIRVREELGKFKLTESQTRRLESQKQLLAKTKNKLDRVIETIRKKGSIEENAGLLTEALTANQEVLGELEDMRNEQSHLADLSLKKARREHKETRTDIILLSVLGALISFVIVLLIVRKIKMQAGVLAHTLEELADANENLEMRVEHRTEELMKARTENMRMNAELQVSRHLQNMLLPKKHELEEIKGLDIAGFMEAAEEVGGDYYDVLKADQRVMFSIGDVTGHGLESGVLMLMVQAAVHTLLASGIKEPQFFMQALNRTVHDNARRLNTDKNMTLSLICAHNNTLQICGQHEDVIIVRKDGHIEPLDTADLGFPLGLIPDIDEFVAQTEVNLEAGDGFVLYTDGITEAMNADKEMYGMTRFCDVISRHWEKDSSSIKQAVIEDVQNFLDVQHDDITLVVVKQK